MATDTFTPKAGMICRTRDGQKVGPLVETSPPIFKWRYQNMAWLEGGLSGTGSNTDLIAEWTEYRPEDDGWEAVGGDGIKVELKPVGETNFPDGTVFLDTGAEEYRGFSGQWYRRVKPAPSLPGLPISELGAKPGDTIRCVWIKDGCVWYVLGMLGVVVDGGIELDNGTLTSSGDYARWEIVKRADKPKGRKRARIKELLAEAIRQQMDIAELDAQVAELIAAGDPLERNLYHRGLVHERTSVWREAVARIKP